MKRSEDVNLKVTLKTRVASFLIHDMLISIHYFVVHLVIHTNKQKIHRYQHK